MAFVDFELLDQTYPTGCMQENIRQLRRYDVFHCLLAGNDNSVAYVKKETDGLPMDFLKWLNVCDGGMLFDTALLSTTPYDAKLDLSFETYDDYYDADLRKSKDIPDDWFIFAEAVHSDVFFFDLGKKDDKVYQWDVENLQIYTEWDNFENWLISQINEAVDLIADEDIDPLDIKTKDHERH